MELSKQEKPAMTVITTENMGFALLSAMDLVLDAAMEYCKETVKDVMMETPLMVITVPLIVKQ